MRFTLTSLVISLCLVLHGSFAQDAGEVPLAEPIPAVLFTRAELTKMKIPELRAMLTARGIRFDGAEKRDFIDRVFEVQGNPTLTPTPTPTAVVEAEDAAAAPPPPPPDFTPPPDFNYEEIMAKMGSGKKRVERLKKKMIARGMDVSGIDSSILGGLADGGGMDDEQLIKILASLGNARTAEGGAPAPNADAATDAAANDAAAAAEDGASSPTPKATKNARKKPTPTSAKSATPTKTTSAKGGKSPKPTQPMSTPKGAATSKKSTSPTPAKKKVQNDETTNDKEMPSATPTPTRRKPSRTPAPKPRTTWQKPDPVVEHVRDEAEEVDLDSMEEEFGGEDLDL